MCPFPTSVLKAPHRVAPWALRGARRRCYLAVAGEAPVHRRGWCACRKAVLGRNMTVKDERQLGDRGALQGTGRSFSDRRNVAWLPGPGAGVRVWEGRQTGASAPCQLLCVCPGRSEGLAALGRFGGVSPIGSAQEGGDRSLLCALAPKAA